MSHLLYLHRHISTYFYSSSVYHHSDSGDIIVKLVPKQKGEGEALCNSPELRSPGLSKKMASDDSSYGESLSAMETDTGSIRTKSLKAARQTKETPNQGDLVQTGESQWKRVDED
ncbi:SNF2-like protein [Penicillium cf. griseofulvum]|uniref:SNF2-like protein n=1 Tax=Penicillium cf. griseofulvum TaxID=2972120 RepID=A0A9W9ILE4_9EURO|nr:SNF2-like protein [Penicillium cf. griseofulvum]KAJ5451556.1 SNF2-like protein [Penicillium cf. griseofulvum]